MTNQAAEKEKAILRGPDKGQQAGERKRGGEKETGGEVGYRRRGPDRGKGKRRQADLYVVEVVQKLREGVELHQGENLPAGEGGGGRGGLALHCRAGGRQLQVVQFL